jgi:hypothetical protein
MWLLAFVVVFALKIHATSLNCPSGVRGSLCNKLRAHGFFFLLDRGLYYLIQIGKYAIVFILIHQLDLG